MTGVSCLTIDEEERIRGMIRDKFASLEANLKPTFAASAVSNRPLVGGSSALADSPMRVPDSHKQFMDDLTSVLCVPTKIKLSILIQNIYR